MNLLRLFFGAACLALCSCTPDGLASYSALDRLRVLALVVDQPSLQNPSAGVTNINLDPYISDIGGSGNVVLTVQSCLDPGVAYGASPTCTNGLFASAPQVVTVTAAGGAPAGTFGSPERTGKPSSGSIVVGLQIPASFLSSYSSALQTNGVAYLITVSAASSTAVVNSFRRILINNQAPNTNPVITDILANGVTLTALPTSVANLSFATSSTPETYTYASADGSTQSITETFEATWFVSDGHIDNPRTASGETTEWAPPASAATGRKTVVVGVLRDGRGGDTVLVREF